MKVGVAYGRYPSRSGGIIQPGTPLPFFFLFFSFFHSYTFVLLHGCGLSLALLAEFLHDSNDTAVAKALEN